jgi:hypothetical protein
MRAPVILCSCCTLFVSVVLWATLRGCGCVGVGVRGPHVWSAVCLLPAHMVIHTICCVCCGHSSAQPLWPVTLLLYSGPAQPQQQQQQWPQHCLDPTLYIMISTVTF